MNKIRTVAALVAASIIVGLSAYLWYDMDHRPVQSTEMSVPATPAPETKRAPTKRVAIAKPVKVFGDGIKPKLKLPDAVAKNVDEHVIAATQVRGSLRPQTVTTVIDEKTGESQTYVKSDPYPWLAYEGRGEIRMSYGYRFDSGVAPRQIVRLNFSYDLIRVKALTIGPTVQVDSDGRTFVGAGLAYRW